LCKLRARRIKETHFCDFAAGALHLRGKRKSAGEQIAPRLANERTPGWWGGRVITGSLAWLCNVVPTCVEEAAPTVAGTCAELKAESGPVLIFAVKSRHILTLQGSARKATAILQAWTEARARWQSGTLLRDAQAVAKVGFCDRFANALHLGSKIKNPSSDRTTTCAGAYPLSGPDRV
jgi:hypothetical protein